MKNVCLLCLLLCTWFASHLHAQNSCSSSNSSEVIVTILTDNYGYETSWLLSDLNEDTIYHEVPPQDYISNTLYTDTVCVPDAECIVFSISDAFGDGICCGFGQGFYIVVVDGDTIAVGGEYDDEESIYFNCPSGGNCGTADTAFVGNYTATTHDYWYVFQPDSTGMYTVSTCGLNTCDTKIWIYDVCQGLFFDETNAGTIFYDNDGVCGSQAEISAAMEVGETYYIRIGDAQDDCLGDSIDWFIQFNGPITGCTDPNSCNYDPLATVDDGSCLALGDPDCPPGPDLLLRQDVMESSMYVTTYNSQDPCTVNEGCLAGLGMRDIIRFTTHIQNIGPTDYFIGTPGANPDQFSYDNCHNHSHYVGYAEYLLFDQSNSPIPIGFKNGFCVMDLECSGGGTGKYGCGNMGITAGCGDIYDAGLDCQWIDITDVPDGDYTVIARVNWDYSPDALGRYESDYENNWAQVCFNLSRTSGSPEITIDPNCPIYTDCEGVAFGLATTDCEGNCNGTAVQGDLTGDETLDITDLSAYLDAALEHSLTATNCNDLHGDGFIDLYDVALLNQCLQDSTACDFPTGLQNIFDTVGLQIIGADLQTGYVDIAMFNPTSDIIGYQFTMGGIVIDSVVNLQGNFEATLLSSPNTQQVLAISEVDSIINRSFSPKIVCRVYFTDITDTEICIASIQSIINSDYQTSVDTILGSCLQVSPSSVGTIAAGAFKVKVAPNPFKNQTRLSFYNPDANVFTLTITDAMGREIHHYSNIRGEKVFIDRKGLTSGIYYYYLSDGTTFAQGKLMVE